MAEEPIWGHNAETEKVEIIGKHRYPAFCATIPMMTEWEWVKSNAKGHPAICQDCVDRILNVQLATPAFAANAEGQFFNDSLPF